MAINVFDKKFYRYVYLRLIRQGGSPHDLAFSVAIGVFCGFLIPVGQMILSLFLAWIFKVNKLVAVACCWVTNPATIPFFFPLNIILGSYFITSKLSKEEFTKISEMPIWEGIKAFFALGIDGMLCFMVGGAIIGSSCAVIAYVVIFRIIKRHNQKKKERGQVRLSSRNTDKMG